MEISKSLNIAKETARRKINELEEIGAIKRINKKIIIDRFLLLPNFFQQELHSKRCISLECGLQNGTLAVFVSTQLCVMRE